MKSPCIIGIDPGLSGAMATYDPVAHEIRGLISMPILKLIQGRHTSKSIDIHQLKKHFDTVCENHDILGIVIEKVHASPQMGVASSFKFGDTFGITRALAEATGNNVHYVSPASWKPKLLLNSDKKQSIEKARKVFGKSPWFIHDSKDGPAEAALLAYYASRYLIDVETDPLS